MQSRLVARVCTQRPDIDFGELYAPTVAVPSVRLLAAMTCEQDLAFSHFDVEQAFVRSELDQRIFTRFPPDCGSLSGMVVRLSKHLYRLKEASR